MKLIHKMILYMLCIVIVLQCYSLLVMMKSNRDFLIVIFGYIVILFLVDRKLVLEKNRLILLMIYAIFMGMLFILGDFKDIEFVFSIVATYILFMLYLDSEERILEILEVFTNIMFLIACISLFFFVFASGLNLIEPSAYYSDAEVNWGVQDYYNFNYIYCEGQRILAFGYNGVRNTALFLEAPMFVYPLAIAIYYELFLRKASYRKYVLAVFVVAIITSFSTTGLLVLVAVFYLKFYKLFMKSNFTKFILIPGLILVALSGAIYIFADKVVNGTISVNARFDDILTTIKCLIDNPVMGIGFENLDGLDQYRIVYRESTGLSTGLGAVFAYGGFMLGIWYMIPIVVGIYKFVMKKNQRKEMGFVILIGALLFVSVVQTRILCTLMNAISWIFITKKYDCNENRNN